MFTILERTLGAQFFNELRWTMEQLEKVATLPQRHASSGVAPKADYPWNNKGVD